MKILAILGLSITLFLNYASNALAKLECLSNCDYTGETICDESKRSCLFLDDFIAIDCRKDKEQEIIFDLSNYFLVSVASKKALLPKIDGYELMFSERAIDVGTEIICSGYLCINRTSLIMEDLANHTKRQCKIQDVEQALEPLFQYIETYKKKNLF